MKERRKAWNPRGHRALSPPELRVLGKVATEMPARLGRRRVPGLAGLEPSSRFCRVKFSDKNFSRPALRYTWAPDSESIYSAPTHACRRTEPPAAATPFHPKAFEKASAAWAPTHRECRLGIRSAPGTHTGQKAALPSAGTLGAPSASGTRECSHSDVHADRKRATLVGAQACAQCSPSRSSPPQALG